MISSVQILSMLPESFCINRYTTQPFRMIGLVDTIIRYPYGVEQVTLAFYRSSGTNSGKIKGLWYPIVGIKTYTGNFTEFTDYLNYVLTKSTRFGSAEKGWLAKSIFFTSHSLNHRIRGFSNGIHYETLFEIGCALRSMYEKGFYHKMNSLDAFRLNELLTSKNIYHGNSHTQQENFERFIKDL